MSRHAAAKAPLLKPAPKPTLDTKTPLPASNKNNNSWSSAAGGGGPNLAAAKPAPLPQRDWHLFQAGYAKSTTDRYRAATQDFTAWCKASDREAETYEELDIALTTFMTCT